MGRYAELKPWMLFAIPAAIAVAIISGILAGGPIVGFLTAVLFALLITGVAIRLEPRAWRSAAARAQASIGRSPATLDQPAERGWRRAAARRLLVPLLIGVPGIVLIAVASSTARIVGWGLLAVAITLTISLVFLEIGLSEDRALAREQRPGRRRAPRHRA